MRHRLQIFVRKEAINGYRLARERGVPVSHQIERLLTLYTLWPDDAGSTIDRMLVWAELALADATSTRANKGV